MSWSEEYKKERLEQLREKPRQVIVRFGPNEIDELEFLESQDYMGKYIKDLIRKEMKKQNHH